ncbi:MAG: tetratricopeptide repeat protein [Rickettsiales bacterium]|jgi:tetratricopeptide (TPR) repeat protein|nr:tetratricopeptide repeat protein [Rickettsiales bacterium]
MAPKKTKKVAKKIAKPVVKKAVKKIPITTKPIVQTPIVGTNAPRKKSRMVVYIYWMIIFFFLCSSFYILGRGQEILKNKDTSTISADAQVLLDNGKIKMANGDIAGAIADIDAAIELDTSVDVLYIYRGEAYMATANYAAATEDFNMAIRLNPKNPTALYNRALLKIQLDELDSALADLDGALDSYKAEPVENLSLQIIYSKRGQLNLWLKNWDAAIADYTAAIGESGENVSDTDMAGRADALTANGKYEDALKDYSAAIINISNNIKNVEDASSRIEMSRRALTYFEKSAALHVQLNDMAAAKGDLEAANTLAAAMNDADTQKRILGLLENLSVPTTDTNTPATDTAPVAEPAPAVIEESVAAEVVEVPTETTEPNPETEQAM